MPPQLNAEYYAPRAPAGLIISEATNSTQQGKGHAFTPAIYQAGGPAPMKNPTDARAAAGPAVSAEMPAATTAAATPVRMLDMERETGCSAPED